MFPDITTMWNPFKERTVKCCALGNNSHHRCPLVMPRLRHTLPMYQAGLLKGVDTKMRLYQVFGAEFPVEPGSTSGVGF